MRYLNQPFFPLLLAIFPVVSVYAHNRQHFLIGVAFQITDFSSVGLLSVSAKPGLTAESTAL